MNSKRLHITTFAMLSLAACGGGGGSSLPQATVPEFTSNLGASAGPAVNTHTEGGVGIQNGVAGGIGRNFTSQLANDGSGDIIISSGGLDYRLAQDPSSGTYLFTSTDLDLAAEVAVSDEAGLLLLVVRDRNTLSGSFHDFGNAIGNTAPLSGSAYYIGPAAYVATIAGVGSTAGSGGFVFEANFDTAVVDGRIALQDLNGTRFNVDFEDATVGTTGFNATNLQVSGLTGITIASALDASFYGAGAEQVAGTFAINRDVDGNTVPDQFLSGGFLGNQQSQEAVAALLNGDPVQVAGGEQIVLGSGSVVGGSGSVYPDGSSSYYNSNTGVSFGADGGGCYYVGDWSNC